tara:strand:+ start:1167 stop:2045 length:879 start_codon:yes stop_codon:yes gene_type:complete
MKNLFFSILISLFVAFKIHSDEVEFDSPEGWGMSYMSAASLNLSDSYIDSLEFGELVVSAELSTIPKLNSKQQNIGFGGLKYESLNKSPVFGRGKLKIGFYWDTIFEFSLTPSVEIKGAKPKDLYGFALSKELFESDNLNLGVRVFNLSGYAVADVTCSAEVVNQPLYTPGNPSGCIETSSDKIDLGHYGFELIMNPNIKNEKFKPWFSLTSSKIDPSVRIDAQLELTREIAYVETKGTLSTFTAGFNYSLSEKWTLNIGTSYTPIDVVRPSPAGGNDNFWNFRIGVSFNTN